MSLITETYLEGLDAYIGALRYLTHTRPNIGFAVGYVSRFMAEPREDHLAAVKHLLCYVAGMRDYGLVYPRRSRGELELIGFSDSDMAATLMDEGARLVCSSSLERARSPGNR